MQLLLENGAQPDFDDEHGQILLSQAIEEGSVAAVQLLLTKRGEIDYKYKIVSELIHMSMGLC